MGTTYFDVFAASLRAARARANLSQEAVSKRMITLGFTGWDSSKISRAERGKTPVEVADLFGLAVALGCTINELVGAHTRPDAVIEFPAGMEVSGVTLRNSVYGWQDHTISWDKGSDYPAISRPATPFSAAAEDKSQMIALASPSRLVRYAGSVIPA